MSKDMKERLKGWAVVLGILAVGFGILYLGREMYL